MEVVNIAFIDVLKAHYSRNYSSINSIYPRKTPYKQVNFPNKATKFQHQTPTLTILDKNIFR